MRTILLALCVLLIAGCARPLFHSGQIVKTKLGGHVGQVIRVDCVRDCIYWVRLSAVEISTNTRFLGQDGAVKISPLADVYLREFELESK